MEMTEVTERGKKEIFTLPKSFQSIKALKEGFSLGEKESKSRKSSTSVSSKGGDSDLE